MAVKYPSLSPYAYCAWNPVKFVDSDGRDVHLSQSAQSIHEKYYRKKGYERYTELYDKLNNDHSILINVKECNDNNYAISQGANGIIDYSETQEDRYKNGCFDVEWGNPNELHGGSNEHVYFEEMFHAGQVKSANYDISAVHTIDSEYDAKVFAAQTSSASYNMTYDDFKNGFYNIPTEMQIINTYDSYYAKEYLKNGIYVEVIDRNNKPYYPYKTGGHYHEFPMH